MYSADATGDESQGMQVPWEAGKGIEMDFPEEPPEEPSPADTVILVQEDHWASDPRSCKALGVKPLSLYYFKP